MLLYKTMTTHVHIAIFAMVFQNDAHMYCTSLWDLFDDFFSC